MLCPLVVVVDPSFLALVHAANVEAAIFQILYSLEEANAIFRSTDFDGDDVPDNIGFYVKKIVVVPDGERAPAFITKYRPETINVGDYLVNFMRFDELSHYCLGIVFTAQKFEKGTLGASFTPDSESLHPTSGICEQPIGDFGTMNALVITASTIHSPLVLQMVFEITIAHELGHSFGSSHDQSSACYGHLMSPKSFGGDLENRTHLVLSPCSKEHILRTLAIKGDCFEAVQTSFCGNGLVEEGEDCDCGLTMDCLQKDPCCVPRRTKRHPCKINKEAGYQCHPSQGACCRKDCSYSPSLDSFANCRNFDRHCPCSADDDCSCGLNGLCSNDECHSEECARIGLKECQCPAAAAVGEEPGTCQICCLYQNVCLPAIETTGRLKPLPILRLRQRSSSAVQLKQFTFKRFCDAEDGQCVRLPFFQGQIGQYCLYRGKVGRCETGARCEPFRPQQSFPSFESASGKLIYTFNFPNAICYFLFNIFLINLAT